MVFGVSIYTICIGNVSTVIASIDNKAAILTQKLATLETYVARAELTEEIGFRIHRYLENDSKQVNSLQEQDDLVADLPPSLKNEVVNFTIKSVAYQVPFFKDKNQDFQTKVLPLLKSKNLYKNDIVFSEGDIADEIIFVLRGSVTLFVDISDLVELPEGTIDDQNQAFNVPIVVYNKGSYFGDEDVLFDAAFD